jgi:protein disulfide-isomerase
MRIRPFSILGLLVMAALSIAGQLRAAEPAAGGGWGESYPQALAESKKSGKPILADFTGSDWCGYCIALKKEVFDTPVFKDWAAKNVILLELDFPRRKPQAPEIKQQNEKLSQQFSIEGFPTILILDGAGKKIGELGYQEGGPEKWIAEFKKQFLAAKK